MLRIWGLGALILLVLSACQGPRATIVPNRGLAAPTCRDGSDEGAPPYEWICERHPAAAERVRRTPLRRKTAVVARADFTPIPPPVVEAAPLPSERLLVPSRFSPRMGAAEVETPEPSLSVEERIAARRTLLPPIPRPPLIDIGEILSTLRGALD